MAVNYAGNQSRASILENYTNMVDDTNDSARTVALREDFGLDNLRVESRPAPTPGPSDVLVRLTAASLNYRDYLMVTGKYNPRQPLPLVPCSDGVGEVVEVGERVERFAVGDRVSPTFFEDWPAGEPSRSLLRPARGGPLDGTLTELFCADQAGFVKVPDHLTDAEAATLTCAGVTAWNALVEQAGIRAGQTVLVQGTGGVSTFAVQFARMHGARVILTSSSDEKLDFFADRFGVEDRINYRDEPDWGRRARELAGGDGVDVVVEVGGAGTIQQSIRAVRPGGHISLIGVLAGGAKDLNLVPVLMQNIRIQGVIVGSRQTHETMNRAIALHELRPLLDRTFSLEDSAEAFRYLADGRHMGKVVIDLTQ